MLGASKTNRRNRRRPYSTANTVAWLILGGVLTWGTVHAREFLRGGSATPAAPAASTTPNTEAVPSTAPVVTSGRDRLVFTNQALEAVKKMQAAARAIAVTGPNKLKSDLPEVAANSYLKINGLMPAAGVPKDLLNPGDGENSKLWTGADLPTVATTGDTSTVTIKQNQQQAVLNWDSFSIGKSTSLVFDQSKGGVDAGQWIAFNKVGVTGSPSQILGSIKAEGQVYVINPNGIIFGGSSQVNAHALVASSLPINDNLISRGLLNNPDAQFLFSTLSIAAGGNGTPGFTPTIADPVMMGGDSETYILARNLAANTTPVVSYKAAGSTVATLTPVTDFALGLPDSSGKTTLTFTDAGLKKIKGAAVTVSYTPSGDQYGNVTVNAGAQLTAPTTADHVGGRIALIGQNVVNAGTISTPDGQAILAAGLQVAMTVHPGSDASLRGLDVYVGAVADPSLKKSAPAGTVINADLTTADIGVAASDVSTATTNPNGLKTLGLIDAPRGDIYITGKNVSQLGFVDSSTSVAYNGRIDLLAYDKAASGAGQPNTPAFLWQETGELVMGADSVTRILPEVDNTDTVIGTTLALRSQINLGGANVTFGADKTSQRGATLLAPNAAVTASAGSWRFTVGGINADTGLLQNASAARLIQDGGNITLGSGATIDVSGSRDVSASVLENIISVQLRGPELANSPVQRNGSLRGQTVQVDIRQNGTLNGVSWVGTPLADASGYVGLVGRNVGELTTDGGTVTFQAGGKVTLPSGSAIDVSGGWINYKGADIQTTKLLTASGRVVDIAQASPDQIYTGIYSGTSTQTDSKWGTTQTTTNPLGQTTYDPGYVQGGNGGALSITAPSMTLAGNLKGTTTPGERQLKAFVDYGSSALQSVRDAGIDPRVWELGNRPMASTLSLTFEKQYLLSGSTNSYARYSPTPPNIYLQADGSPAPTDSRALVLSSSLIDSSVAGYGGFGNLKIDNSNDNYQIISPSLEAVLPVDPLTNLPVVLLYGSITVSANPADSANRTLSLAPGGSLVLDAGNIAILGGITAPGGQLSFTAHNFWQGSTLFVSQFGLPDYNEKRGNFTLGDGVVVDASGLVIDNRATATSGTAQPLVTAGGTIAIAGSNVAIAAGSRLKVNGGATIGGTGKVAYGAGGALSLKAGSDPAFGNGGLMGGKLIFNVDDQASSTVAAELKPFQGYAGVTGGSLTIAAPKIQIGTVPGVTSPSDLLLSPEFFSGGGFSAFNIQGQGRALKDAKGDPLKDADGRALYTPGLSVAAGTTLYPRVQNSQVAVTSSGYTRTILSPQSYQNTPVNLQFSAVGASDPGDGKTGINALVARGDLVVGEGAVIKSDALGSISLSGQTVSVLGSISTPGGAISIRTTSPAGDIFPNIGTSVLPTVDLGSKSLLSTAGATILTADVHGRLPGDADYLRSGSVTAGGTISVTGNVLAETGAVMDVSGWSDAKDKGGLLYLAPALSGKPSTTSNVSPTAFDVIPTLVETSGGSVVITGRDGVFLDATLKGAAGGATAAGGTLSITSGIVDSTSPPVTALQVVQSGPTVPADGKTKPGIGRAIVDADGKPLAQFGYFAADTFAAGGFDNLALNGNVEFHGAVKIAARGNLSVGNGGLIAADKAVTLSGNYVALGTPYQGAPGIPNPFSGLFSSPKYGSGSLSVTAGSASRPGLIDIGNLSLVGIGDAALNSVAGDIRGYGTLDLAGSISLTAGQIYPVTAEKFTIFAQNYSLPTDAKDALPHAGSVTFVASGSRQQPLSAGGALNVYAQVIDQGGVLRAPIGTINLGWDGTGSAPVDPLSNLAAPVTQQLVMRKGSETSVSGTITDPTTGKEVPIPYGVSLDGSSWIDPSGIDISSGGLPAKSIRLTAGTVAIAEGASINTSGGGDLYAYEFVKGVGGTNDVLSATSASFAVLPWYQSDYAPDAGFNTTQTPGVTNLLRNVDQGYVSVTASGVSRLAVGDKIHLDLQNGLGARDYTLLPARYALLPGAYLVTPKAASVLPAQAVKQADGSVIATGYRFNSFTPTHPLYTQFEIAAKSVVQTRAQYADFSANAFFAPTTTDTTVAPPRLPKDGGQLVVAATKAMALQGSVSAAAASGGRGGLVDISSPNSIVINTTGTGADADTLYLSSSQLSAFASGSLLVGGVRTTGADGTQVTTKADNLTVDNAGQALTGSDVILVANEKLTLAAGAEVAATTTATTSSADSLVITGSIQLDPVQAEFIDLTRAGSSIGFPSGTPTKDTIKATVAGTITRVDGTTIPLQANTAVALDAGSKVTLTTPGRIIAAGTGKAIPLTLGDGTMLRVSSAATAASQRTALASSKAPALTIGAGAKISGNSVVVDSTYVTKLDSTATIGGGAVALNSGQISLVLNDSSKNKIDANSLVLSGAALGNLQTGAKALALLSYSSIDTYGAGVIGSSSYASLDLHAGEIRGFNLGADERVVLAAHTVSLDNSPAATGAGVAADFISQGALAISADKIVLGSNALLVDQFSKVEMNASNGVVAKGQGSFSTSGDLTVTTPVLVGTGGARQSIVAGGALKMNATNAPVLSLDPGLGANVTLSGASVNVASNVTLPSGVLTLHATGSAVVDKPAPDVVVAGTLDVSGTSKTFQGDLVKYTDAGQIELISDSGSVNLTNGASLKLAAPVAAGNAGNLSVVAPLGSLVLPPASPGTDSAATAAPMLDARLGLGGAFSLDVASLRALDGSVTTSLGALESSLAAGNFSRSQDLRIRTGDVAVDGTIKSREFILSADTGSIEVGAKGLVDASGSTGGTIELAAGGSVRLLAGSELTVQGTNFDHAGKAGSISLEAGSSLNAASGTRGTGNRFDAGVAAVDLQAGSKIDLSVVNDRAMQLNSSGTSSITLPVGNIGLFFPSGTPGNDQVAFSNGGTITTAAGEIIAFTASASKPYLTSLSPGSTVVLTDAGSVTFASGSGGSIPVSLPSTLADGTTLKIDTNKTAELAAFNSTGSLHLRAPQVLNQNDQPYDVQIDPIGSTFLHASNSSSSSIAVEGYRVFDLTPLDTGSGAVISGPMTTSTSQAGGGVISDPGINIQASVQDNGALFAGGILSDGSTATGNTAAITAHLLDGAVMPASLQENFHVRPGAEIVNTSGDLVLNSTWDLAAGATYFGEGDPADRANWSIGAMPFRFGAKLEPGYLTLRAKGDLVFGTDPDNPGMDGNNTPASLNDGFSGYDGYDNGTLWGAVLLPSGIKSWSYRLVSGADFAAADSRQILRMPQLDKNKGSVVLGRGVPPLKNTLSGVIDLQSLIPPYYQTIRTGSGDITVTAGRDVRIANNLATIYTAGEQTDPLKNFDLPVTDFPLAQYATGGGDLSITAQGNIAHVLASGLADSSKELPMNWLYRRGWVGANGQFGSTRGDAVVDSTSWWVNYANFFEGVGALGGGNVTLQAGMNVSNVDAVIPTNLRTLKQTTMINDEGKTVPVETRAAYLPTFQLGGGDLTVRAGNDIDGGVYYVERGNGDLQAGNSIHSNSTRTTVAQSVQVANARTVANAGSWLPTTLFVGNGSFDVRATNDLILGPVANAFLQPQSAGNNAANGSVSNEKTYFSTYATSDAVRVSSLTGNVTVKDHPDLSVTNPGFSGSLLEWYANHLSTGSSGSTASTAQPWLNLAETNTLPFTTVAGLMPGSLSVTAFGGDVNLVGGVTLAPAPKGQVALAASGSINGVQPNIVGNTGQLGWGSAMINLSDADPGRVPGPSQPLALSFAPVTAAEISLWRTAANDILPTVDILLKESGSSTGNYAVIQTKQALHGSSLLHADDTTPVMLYAEKGDISGLTLFAGKNARVLAGQDITDAALYVQNNRATDVTTVAAGRDLVPYTTNSTLRAKALSSGGQFISNEAASVPASGTPTAGDIQLGGPGRLEILAGRNLNLGVGPAAADGTSVGVKTIGNTRNPNLPFTGADIVAAAGVGPATGLGRSELDFTAFIAEFLNPVTAGAHAPAVLPDLGTLLGIVVDPKNPGPGNADVWKTFNALPQSQQNVLALEVFYLVLRDAGRDRNNAKSTNFGNYNNGYEAVVALFGSRLDFNDASASGFIDLYLNPATGGQEAKKYLPQLNSLIGGNGTTDEQIWQNFTQLPSDQQHGFARKIFGLVLDDAAKLSTNLATNAAGKEATAKVLAAIFGQQTWRGNISMATRLIETTNGGNITMAAPGGDITVGRAADPQKPDQGVLTAHGGNISLFANGDVNVGTSRIFTLRGGNEIIWSSNGNIAAGSGSKTVKAAPPTRVLIDPQSGDVKNDLAGLATGGGIGVLATLANVAAGDVDLIAPVGTVDAGDAGIRSSGNLNIAAAVVLNASNIQVGGATVGTPPPPPAPNLGALTAATTASAGASTAATDVARQNTAGTQATELPSMISVEVLGYGGDDDDEDEQRKNAPKSLSENSPVMSAGVSA